MFGVEKSPGLTDYLMERASVDEILQETEVEGLWLIARGSLEGFNADHLDDELMDELLPVLRESYDAAVIDGPPLAAGADALLLGERADKVLLVIRAGTTNEELAGTKYYNQYVSYYYVDAELA